MSAIYSGVMILAHRFVNVLCEEDVSATQLPSHGPFQQSEDSKLTRDPLQAEDAQFIHGNAKIAPRNAQIDDVLSQPTGTLPGDSQHQSTWTMHVEWLPLYAPPTIQDGCIMFRGRLSVRPLSVRLFVRCLSGNTCLATCAISSFVTRISTKLAHT